MGATKAQTEIIGLVVLVAVIALGVAVWQWQKHTDSLGFSSSDNELTTEQRALGKSSIRNRSGGNDAAGQEAKETEEESVVVTTVNLKDFGVLTMKDWDADALRDTFGLEKINDKWLPAITLADEPSQSVTSAGGNNPIGEAESASQLYITTGSIPNAIVDESYHAEFVAIGGSPPYHWEIAGGSLPEGVALDPIKGTITGVPEIPGTAAFELRISDSNEKADLAVFDLTVSESSLLRILTDSLPRALQDEKYLESIIAEGGEPPYRWSFESPLPRGTAFSEAGVLEGVPEETGKFKIALRVEDSAGAIALSNLTLSVAGREGEGVTDFEGLFSLRRVALRWTPPGLGTTVRIVRSEKEFPETPKDGTTVFTGTDTSFVDRRLDPGRHFYAAFVEGADPAEAPPAHLSIVLSLTADPFADAVVDSSPLHSAAFHANRLPDIVLGSPQGTGLSSGGLDIFSLGAAVNDDNTASSPYGGAIIIEFLDNDVLDGPGADFTVFENVFYVLDQNGNPDSQTRFMEPAVVSVSQDGATFYPFRYDFSPRLDPETGEINLRHPFVYHRGFAGINPVISQGFDPDPTDPAMSGGDSFDIGELGLDWIRYVRIQSTGHLWLTDGGGDLVHHNEEAGAAMRAFNKSGFDLDAVSAIWIGKEKQQ